MNENQEVAARRRRSSEEVKRLVLEFEASGLRRNDFCRDCGMALSTLRRHFKKHGSGEGGVKAGNRLVAVELAKRDRNTKSGGVAALEVVLCDGRRIAVRQQFDSVHIGPIGESAGGALIVFGLGSATLGFTLGWDQPLATIFSIKITRLTII